MEMKKKSYKDECMEKISYAVKAACLKNNIDVNQITADRAGHFTYYMYEKKVLVIVEWSSFRFKIDEY